ncbi:MAG: hypothetical protein ABI778_09285 [Ignavibacteriota bacterium]
METIQAQEELAFIRKVMEDSRSSYVDDGKPKIVWGAIVAAAMLYTYMQALADSDLYVSWVWIGLSVLGWAYIFWNKSKRETDSKSRTYTGKIIGAIWGGCGAAVALVVMLTMVELALEHHPIIHPVALCPLTALIIGIAYFLDGTVRVVPWVRNLALAWWVGAIAMFYWPSVHVLLLYSVMVIAFQFVPGVVLLRKSQRSTQAV